MLVAEKGRRLPFFEQHARHVESIVRSGRAPFGESKREKEARLRWEPTYQKVWLSATEHDEIYPGRIDGLPFDGVTRDRLRLIDSILHGYPCRVWTAGRGEDDPFDGIWAECSMPGRWNGSAMLGPYDIAFRTNWERDGTACYAGTSRVLGLGAILRLEALSMDPWYTCHQCSAWRPRELLTVEHRYTEDEDGFDSVDLICRKQVPSDPNNLWGEWYCA